MEYINLEQVSTKFGNEHNELDFYFDSISNFNDQDIIDINLAYGTEPNQDMPMRVCIVVPTYNEVNNIPNLLGAVFSEEQKLKYDARNIVINVLVVDDNSPDGTADVVKAFQKSNPNIHLLERNEKNGLGAAYIAGMQHAMKLLKPSIIFEMDGDLSHGPEYILPMIDKIREGADFVIGSRYVKGGSIPDNWGLKRKLISRSANFYAKTILRIREVNDCTGGFRAIRASVLEQIDLSSLKTKGYAFQISLLEAMRRNNAIMSEVPIAFKDRTKGASKMTAYDIIEEGLFVFRTSLENIFYSSKRPVKQNQEQERLLLRRQPAPTHQLEYSLATGIAKEPFEVEAVNMCIDKSICTDMRIILTA